MKMRVGVSSWSSGGRRRVGPDMRELRFVIAFVGKDRGTRFVFLGEATFQGVLTEGSGVEGEPVIDHLVVQMEQEHELVFIEDGRVFMKAGEVSQAFEEVRVKLR